MARPVDGWETWTYGRIGGLVPNVQGVNEMFQVSGISAGPGQTLIRTVIDVRFEVTDPDLPAELVNAQPPWAWGVAFVPEARHVPDSIVDSDVDWVWWEGIEIGQPIEVVLPSTQSYWVAKGPEDGGHRDSKAERLLTGSFHRWFFVAGPVGDATVTQVFTGYCMLRGLHLVAA